MSNLFLSLCLTGFMSFAALATLVGCTLGLLNFVSYIPGLENIGNLAIDSVLNFLAVFGNQNPLEGAIALCITFSIVGILLDLANFYRYQSWKDKDFS